MKLSLVFPKLVFKLFNLHVFIETEAFSARPETHAL